MKTTKITVLAANEYETFGIKRTVAIVELEQTLINNLPAVCILIKDKNDKLIDVRELVQEWDSADNIVGLLANEYNTYIESLDVKQTLIIFTNNPMPTDAYDHADYEMQLEALTS